MSFEPPEGILDIGNATLRVGKLEVAETSGLNQGLLNIVKNNLLITENTEYSINHHWGIKLPTTWVADFDVKGHSGKYVEFNFYNEDKTSNTSGYTLTFMDTSLTLKYDNGTTLASATIPTIVDTYRKVNIFFERNVIAVSIDGTRVLYYKRPSVLSRVISTTGSAFVNVFIEENADDSAFKNLRIVNGRFISDKTSNIAFMGGNLGVGVNSPQEALDIRGNMHFNRVSNVSSISVDSNVVTEYTGPHDRPLREYPEIAMTTTSETSSGYKGYKVSTSSQLTNYEGYHAFDKTGWETPASENNNAWVSGGSKYVAATGAPDTGAATTSYVGGTATGEYVQLQLPRKIKISKYDYTPRTHTGNDEGKGAPKTVKLLGSNNGSTWTLIKDITHLGTRPEEGVFYTAQVGATEYYDYIRFVATSTYSDGTSPTFTDVRLSQIRFYGHEEGSGSLDTTLKSVYNVPATTGTQLDVYYDGQDYSGVTSTVTDKVGTATNATISNSGSTITFDSTYKAWTFGGSSGRTDTFRSSNLPSTFTGNQVHSITLWFNMSNISDGSIFVITPSGGENGGDVIMGQTQGDGARISYSFWGNDVSFDLPTNLATGSWYHLSMTYDATDNSTGRKMFLNGIECTAINTASGSLSLPNSNMIISFANRVSQTTYPFFGSIANFRLYSKALNADQVKELYDYQKDYFLGSKSQVTLYKGHLGVGVTEPSGQLELAGDERIQEYPPRAMTKNETLVEGHGVFSALGGIGGETYAPWKAFDKSTSTFWIDVGIRYSDVTPFGALSTASKTTLYDGSVLSGGWIDLECPYPVKLKKVGTAPRTNYSSIGLQRGIILGSNNGVDWYQIDTIDYAGTTPPNTLTYFDITTETYYSHLRLVCTNLTARYPASGTSDMHWQMGELVYFGTPGPTTLDKGSLTLGRSLDVPRVSRYDVDTETPRPEKLLVDFDTTVNRWPVDISGKFNDGKFYGDASYSPADKAFKFDGADDYIQTGSVGLSGTNPVFSVSLWVNYSGSGSETLCMIGDTYGNGTTLWLDIASNSPRIIFVNNDVTFSDPNTGLGASPPNVWNHIVYVYNGTPNGGRSAYVNGVKQVASAAVGGDPNGNLVLPSTSVVTIGALDHSTGFIHEMVGQISNFKLYSVALEPSEVKKLYNLGRTGRSMVISDTAVGIGKAPEAQLDVRGVTRFDGRVGIGTNVPNFALHIHGNNKGVTATTGNQWINWLTNPNYNGTYNGDSPAYPVTTHASMTNTTVYSRHSIGCSGYLWSHGSTLNMSDRRVKTNIVDVNDDTCLRTLRQLKPKHYNYINIRERGSDPVWGFIAQEVKEAIPYSTTLKTDYIPNIDEKARLLDDGRTIVFTNFNTASLESNATTIRILNKNQDEFDITLTEVLDPNTIRVKEDITEHTFVYDQEDDNGNVLEGNYVYVYGQEIDDFVYLKKDAIWTVTTAALQEVDRQLQYERARNDALEARVTVLEQAKYM